MREDITGINFFVLSLNAINPHNLHLCSSQHYAHFHCAMHVNAHFMITLIVLNCRLEDTNMRSIKKVSPNCNLPSSISFKLVTVSLILVIQFTQITNDFCTDFVSFFRLQHAHEFFALLISLKKGFAHMFSDVLSRVDHILLPFGSKFLSILGAWCKSIKNLSLDKVSLFIIIIIVVVVWITRYWLLINGIYFYVSKYL